MSLRRRTFPEVLENLLTKISGGVAAEPHPFPPDQNGASLRHDLQQPPVGEVVSVYGSRDGLPHLFRKGEDYSLLEGRTLAWQEGAELPDAGTSIQVNYYPEAAQPVLTDLYTGSVVRTLSESIALELAGLYAQLDAVYQSGFVDTASGSALDNVVALLGIERVQGGRAAGEVEFTRSPGSRGIITILAGTIVATADGEVQYETTESVTLTQNTIRVAARDLEPNDPLPAGVLTVLSLPIAGISGVTNPAPTIITTRDETDEELRTRAKNFLHGSERATLGAISQAIAREGVTADVVEPEGAPGRVEITAHADSLPPELQQRLLTAIEESRPAGVKVVLQGIQQPRRVNLNLRITTAEGLIEQDLRAAQRSVREKVEDYLARLPASEPGSINRIVGLILGVPGVLDVRFLSATRMAGDAVEDVLDLAAGQLDIAGSPTVLGDLHIADPNLPTVVRALVSFLQDDDLPVAQEIQAALDDALAYLNGLNASDQTPESQRTLSFGKLLFAIPLPVEDKPTGSLAQYDAAGGSGTDPQLPDETSIMPYRVQFVFTQESGLTRILSGASDPPYVITPFERLSPGGVELQSEAGDG